MSWNSSNIPDQSGKTVIVTGGNSGIGLATARRFVSEGAFVFITGRRQEELDKAAREIGHDVQALQGDVSKLDDLDRIVATIREEKGRLDIVFANAGINGVWAPIEDLTVEEWQETINVNLNGTFYTIKAAAPLWVTLPITLTEPVFTAVYSP